MGIATTLLLEAGGSVVSVRDVVMRSSCVAGAEDHRSALQSEGREVCTSPAVRSQTCECSSSRCPEKVNRTGLVLH